MRKIRELNKRLKEGKKPVVKKPSDAGFVERRSGLADRRKIPTFIANDRRNGVVDRRHKAKRIP